MLEPGAVRKLAFPMNTCLQELVGELTGANNNFTLNI